MATLREPQTRRSAIRDHPIRSRSCIRLTDQGSAAWAATPWCRNSEDRNAADHVGCNPELRDRCHPRARDPEDVEDVCL